MAVFSYIKKELTRTTSDLKTWQNLDSLRYSRILTMFYYHFKSQHIRTVTIIWKWQVNAITVLTVLIASISANNHLNFFMYPYQYDQLPWSYNLYHRFFFNS